MTNKNISIAKGVIPLLFLSFLFSCTPEATDIGVNLRPDGGIIGTDQVQFDSFVCRTIAEDSLRTDSLSVNNIGAINDPLFGTRIASLIVQPQLEESQYDFTGTTIDSVFLILKYRASQIIDQKELPLVYGDLDSEIDLDIYQLDEDLVPEDRYYSNYIPTLGTYVGSYLGKFQFYDSVWIVEDGDSFLVNPELRIPLDNFFGQTILNQPTSVFESNEDFLNFLKGLVIVPNTSGLSPGQGAIVGVDARHVNSGLQLHYNDSLSVNFPMSTDAERINLWSIENLSSTISSQETGSGHYNTTYVQSLDGNKVKVDVPQIDSFIENTIDVVINEAAIEFAVDASSISASAGAPYRLLLAAPNEDGNTAAIIDFIDDALPPSFDWVGNTNYGGRYNSDNVSYEFHFNRYLQHLIQEFQETGVNNFRGFYVIVPSDNPQVSSRVVLNTDPSSGGIKVSVSFTKLN